MDHSHDTPAPEFGLGPDPEGVRSILAIRPGGVGDAVRAVPALRHLRGAYPNAVVTVAAPAPGHELLDACPYVDRVIDLAAPSEAIVTRFDVALSWAEPGRGEPLDVDAVNAGFRASWRRAGEGERRAIHPAWPERLDDTTRMLRLAWLLGGAFDLDASLGLWPSLADRNGAAKLVDDRARPLALVHAGASRSARRWPADRWGIVVDQLHDAGFAVVLVGTRVDRTASNRVLASTRADVVDVVGRTSIGELAGLLERAALFVGGDSGPAAMAGALGVRSVLVGPGSSFEHDVRPGLVDVVDAGPCARCGSRDCVHGARSASDVPLERVLSRVELVAATARQRWRRSHIA